MENSNKKVITENQNLQINANATKNNLLQWIVIENFKEHDFLTCTVYECNVYQYRIDVIKSENLINALAGDVIKEFHIAYNYISPDGFTIYYENFKYKDQADDYLKIWLNSFSKQGYYSSVKYGKIPLSELQAFCEFKRFFDEDSSN